MARSRSARILESTNERTREYRVSPTSRLEISKRNVATAAFFQQYRKLLDLVTLFSLPLALSQGHAVVVGIDPSTGLATFEGFLLSFYLVDR